MPFAKLLSNILCLEAPGSCPGFLSQAPGPLPDGAVSISTLHWLQMLCQGPLVVFWLQSSRLTMQAKSNNTNFDGLHSSSLVRCSRRAEVCLDGTLMNAFRVGSGCLGACDLRHGARGADACCTLCVKWVSDKASPGTLLAPALSGQGKAAAAAQPDACFSKGCSSTASFTPLQRPWGSKAHTHTQACTHTTAHTCAHTHTRTRTHTNTITRANTHRHTRTHTHAHAQTHTHTHTHMHACTHTHKHTGTRAHTYAYARVARVMENVNACPYST